MVSVLLFFLNTFILYPFGTTSQSTSRCLVVLHIFQFSKIHLLSVLEGQLPSSSTFLCDRSGKELCFLCFLFTKMNIGEWSLMGKYLPVHHLNWNNSFYSVGLKKEILASSPFYSSCPAEVVSLSMDPKSSVWCLLIWFTNRLLKGVNKMQILILLFFLYPYFYRLHVWTGISSSCAFGCVTNESLILGETSSCLCKQHNKNWLRPASGKNATFGLHWCK